MKKYLVSMLVVLSLVSFGTAQASALTQGQVNAIISILQAFGVDSVTVANVQNELTIDITIPQATTADLIQPEPVATTTVTYKVWIPANLQTPVSQPVPVANPSVVIAPISTPIPTSTPAPISVPTPTPITTPVSVPIAPAPTPAPISAPAGTSSLVASVGDLNWPTDISGNVWEVAQIFLHAQGSDGVNLNSLTITDESDPECPMIIYEGTAIYENNHIVYSSGGTSSTFPNSGNPIFISSTTRAVLNVASNCTQEPRWSATTGTPSLFELTNISATDAVTGAQDTVTGQTITE